MLQLFWPPLAILVLFIGVVVTLLLRYGAKYCRLRHNAKPEPPRWGDAAYEQRVSYA